MLFHVSYTPDCDMENVTDGRNVAIVCSDCVSDQWCGSSSEVTKPMSLDKAKAEQIRMIMDEDRRFNPIDCPHTNVV